MGAIVAREAPVTRGQEQRNLTVTSMRVNTQTYTVQSESLS